MYILLTSVLLSVAWIMLPGSIYGQTSNGNSCAVPSIPRTQAVDPAQMSGVWYEYLVYTPGIVGDNVYNVLIPLNTQTPGIITYNRTLSFLLRTPAPQCVVICLVGNIGTDGKEATTGWFLNPTPGGPPVKSDVVYNTLFTDYHSLQIKMICNQASAAGTCDAPYFWAYTRVKPTLLDQSTKNYIDDTVSNVLAPFCFSTRNLTFTGWDDSLPSCRPTLPADCSALMQSVKQTSNSMSSNMYSSSPVMQPSVTMRGNFGFFGFPPGRRPA
ncbi:uncharacterized protein LOC129598237 [Paramacrobiotus metropolitanus]|uniref:uncharacterized protein LOC129598237 n=1 Tax=Paramacrobiotus metropolitanus TaxID=2943436 RepID=UPI002446318D|nr:uncharacterized protein LOC129598237 [Paramacrobiotus metropolitanus]